MTKHIPYLQIAMIAALLDVEIIDNVYTLYGLTDDEIKVVEKAVKK